ncbi:MAG TPA: IPT/TIG domain-containing protein [Pseudobacter sp.]|nr:IPT/TIG domain-containing protein [Pseudobacter sp.]
MKTVILRQAARLLALYLLVSISSCKRDSPEDNKLILTSFTPEQGSEGGAVVLTGVNFSSAGEKNIVRFNGLQATVTEAASDGSTITVVVPENAATGKITIKVDEQEVVSGKDFTVNPLAPVITSFTPASGEAGTVATITGNHFKAPVKVYFGDVEATVVSLINKTTIEATIPANATTGKIKVICNGTEGIGNSDFYAAPVVGEISPAKASAESVIDIPGKNFDPVLGNNIVYFGEIAGEIASATPTLLRVRVPENATNGKLRVSVRGLSTQTPNDFTLITSISDFHPRHGAPGTTVMIIGRSFGSNPIVDIGGYPCPVVEKQIDYITVTIPDVQRLSGALLSQGKLAVKGIGEKVSTASDFEVTNIWKKICNRHSFSYAEGVSFIANNRIYLLSGRYSTEVVEFNPETARWAIINTMPSDISGGLLGVLMAKNNKAYLGNVLSGNPTAAWYEFNPAVSGAGAWKRMPDFPNGRSRYGGFGLNLSGKLYAGLGHSNTNVYELDPGADNGNGQWSAGSNLNLSVFYLSQFVIDGIGYVGCGYANGTYYSAFYKVDPNVTPVRLIPIAPFPYAVDKAPAYSLNGKGYVIHNSQAYSYNPANNTWTNPGFSVPIVASFAQVLNNKAYIISHEGEVCEYIPNR